MTATYYPTSGFDFDPSGLLTTLKNLIPQGRSSVLDTDAMLSSARGNRLRRYELTSASGDKMELTVSEGIQPEWFERVLKASSRLILLESGWNSYGAHPIDLKSLGSALVLLLSIREPGLPTPELVPTPRGTIQIEWHTRGIDLEIDALPRGGYRLSFENFRTNEIIEDLITSNLDDLSRPLRLLSVAPQSA